MKTGFEVIVRGNNLGLREGHLGLANLSLVKSEEGPILFDVGHYSNRVALLESLNRSGLEPSDVKTVFLSHLHFDHSVNIDIFTHSRVLVGKAEWNYAAEPNPSDTFIPWMIRDQLERHDLVLIEGEGSICPGVDYIHVPGHTPGCYALALDTEGGKVVLAGDAIETYRDVVTMSSTMPFASEGEASRSIERILSVADRIVPGHFPELVKVEGRFVWDQPGELDILVK